MTTAQRWKPAEIRARLSHPIIDTDGHMLEVTPVLLDHVREVGGNDMVEKYRGPNPVNNHYRNPYWGTPPEARRDAWSRSPSFWGFPAKNTVDRATATFPGFFHRRMDELGLDFSVVYPTEGLQIPTIEDAEFRRVMCRAFNNYVAELYGPYKDRMTPAAIIPMDTPEEAIAELDHAVKELGLKAVMLSGAWGCIKRPIPKMQREYPEAAHLLWRPDYFGLDSEFDYDPVWQKCVDLRVAATFHCGQTGWGARQSISSFMY